MTTLLTKKSSNKTLVICSCATDPCSAESLSVLYDGECRDVLEDGACGEDNPGERLYLGEDGRGHCDCDEGWLRYQAWHCVLYLAFYKGY